MKVQLAQQSYTVAEIAYLLGVDVRTVRRHMRTDSARRPGTKLLVATKERTLWRVSRDELQAYLEERFA